MELTAAIIKGVIMRHRHRVGFCLPEYCPKGWWPCDVWEVTKANYSVEYEVKVTKADFLNDSKKQTKNWRTKDITYKHDLLEKGDPRGPSRFYYVVPKGLIPLDLVPKWAGLIEITDAWVRGFGCEITAKNAPQLHRVKVDEKIIAHAKTIPYWRFHTLMRGLFATALRDMRKAKNEKTIPQTAQQTSILPLSSSEKVKAQSV